MNTFTFLTFTRPLAIPSDVSAALLKHSLAFVAIYAEEGYSILTETSTQKVFVSDNKILILIFLVYLSIYLLTYYYIIITT